MTLRSLTAEFGRVRLVRPGVFDDVAVLIEIDPLTSAVASGSAKNVFGFTLVTSVWDQLLFAPALRTADRPAAGPALD